MCRVFFIFVCNCRLLRGRPTVTANVLQLQEVGDFGDENCLPALHLIRSTNVQLTTEAPIY